MDTQHFLAVILGIIEGLTEFLPVSSTGHLLLAQHILGLSKENWEAFTVVIQLGAIMAVVAVYWKKFWNVLMGLPREREAQQFTLSVFVAFIPSAIAGLLLIKIINAYLLQPDFAVPVIAVTWILGGILMLVLEKIAPVPRYTDSDRLPLWKAFQIGLCQVVSIIPGVSRSGATILGAEMLGVDRKAAAAFTFYLAVPTMLGASVLELYKKHELLGQSDMMNIVIGFIVAFIVAYGVVRTFIAFVGRFGLVPFAWYRIIAGVIVLGVLFASHA
ncbi:MAG: undecaprenyl-diphosphate phosphatase [Pseudomonadota bacterium]